MLYKSRTCSARHLRYTIAFRSAQAPAPLRRWASRWRLPVVAATERLEAVHFRKSIASHADHRRWQDVYHLPIGGLVAYVKFIDNVVLEFVLLSFKER